MHNYSIFHPPHHPPPPPPVKTPCLTDIREISGKFPALTAPLHPRLFGTHPIRNMTIQNNKTSNLLLLKRLQNAEFCAAGNE